MQADYVIVGAGSAGCVLANRLTEDPDTRVILLEAGGKDWNPYIHIPAGYIKLLDHPTLTWGFKAAKESGLNGREIPYPRGRVLGGSSSINGLIYIRSQPEDYDHWSQLGNRGWGAKDVFPFFRKAENWDGPADDVHAKGGPLFTSLTRDQPELCKAAIEAGQELGWEYREDLNDLPHRLGDHIGWVQQTRGGRFRASAARSYLRPAMKRPNLEVVTNAMVHRLILDGKRAVGVEFSRGGVTQRADAAAEVIVSAGAIGSPHILQLSGIGDPDHLGRIGVDVHHELRGVGKNFQDHFIVRVQADVKDIATLNERARGIRFAGELMKYALQGRGLLTYAASLVAASVKALPESATPDVQALFSSGSFAPGPKRKLDTKPGMTTGVWQMRPESRGYVEARSSDPREQPEINPNYLAHRHRRYPAGQRLVQFAGTEALCGRRECPGRRSPERRRAPALCTPVRHDGVPCDLFVPDGPRPNVSGGRSAAGAWDGRAACHRCLGHAGGNVDKHQRADHHDRRERCGDAERGCTVAVIYAASLHSDGLFSRRFWRS